MDTRLATKQQDKATTSGRRGKLQNTPDRKRFGRSSSGGNNFKRGGPVPMEHTTMHETIMTNDSVAANDSNTSGVAWGAVIGGAFVTAALSLTLLALGT